MDKILLLMMALRFKLPLSRDPVFNDYLKRFTHYLSAAMVTKVIAFISLPIVLRMLTPEEYGITSVFLSTTSILAVVLTLNLVNSIGRYNYENRSDFNSYFTTLLITISFLFVLTSVVLFLSRSFWIPLLNIPPSFFLYLFPATYFLIISSLFNQVFKPKGKSKIVSFALIAHSILHYAMAIIFMSLHTIDRSDLFLKGILVNGALFTVVYIIMVRKYLTPVYTVKSLQYAVHFAFPLLPYALSGIILTQFDRIMINSSVSSASAGYYSFAVNIGALFTVFFSSLYAAWLPAFYKLMSQKQFNIIDSHLSKVLHVIIIGGITLLLFSKEIGLIIAPQNYGPSLNIIPIIIMGNFFYALFFMFEWSVTYSKKTIFSSMMIIFGGIINIVLNATFIPKFGPIAGAYTTLVSYALMALFSWIISFFIIRVYTPSTKLVLKSISAFLIPSVILLATGTLSMSIWIKFLILIVLITYSALSLLRSRSISHSA